MDTLNTHTHTQTNTHTHAYTHIHTHTHTHTHAHTNTHTKQMVKVLFPSKTWKKLLLIHKQQAFYLLKDTVKQF